MRGRPRKHPDLLQDRRPSRLRPLLTVPAPTPEERAALIAGVTREVERHFGRATSPAKARVARGKARDGRGRFVRAAVTCAPGGAS